MAIYKRGSTYWYEFQFNGERIQESAQTGNKDAARQIEAAHRVRLAKGEAGIAKRPPAPTLKDFSPRFERTIETDCADKPATVRFYKEKLRRLLGDPQLAGRRLDAIDEAVIDAYKARRARQASRYGRPLSPGSVNRELATLRRLLRKAQEWKVLDRVPRIRLLRGERNREFVLSARVEPVYLDAAQQPLKDVALLMLDTGIRVGEAVGLQWPDVYLQPAVHAKLGYITIRKGKTKNANRNLPLTARVLQMLKARKIDSKSSWVFSGNSVATAILSTSLDHQHAVLRKNLKLPPDFVLHSLRHTMLTRLGEAGADSFTIMRVAGHSSVTISQRYVHPTPESMERAFERLQELNQTKQERVKAETGAGLPAKVTTSENQRHAKSRQIVELKERALSSVG